MKIVLDNSLGLCYTYNIERTESPIDHELAGAQAS